MCSWNYYYYWNKLNCLVLVFCFCVIRPFFLTHAQFVIRIRTVKLALLWLLLLLLFGVWLEIFQQVGRHVVRSVFSGFVLIVYVSSAESDISLFIPGQTMFYSASPYVCLCLCVCLSIATPSCDKWGWLRRIYFLRP